MKFLRYRDARKLFLEDRIKDWRRGVTDIDPNVSVPCLGSDSLVINIKSSGTCSMLLNVEQKFRIFIVTSGNKKAAEKN